MIRGEIDPPIVAEPRVPRPLDAICRRAMSLDPGDRYDSARDLARDLERWMAGEAVSAHRDSIPTRLVRWGRRHKPLVAASAALLLAAFLGLAVGLVVVGRQRQRAEDALLVAEVARQHAREHLKVGLDLIDQLVTFGDRRLIAQQAPDDRARFLRTAESFLRSFREREPDDPEVQRDSGMIARRLANLYRLTGAPDQAGPLYRESVTILSALADHPGSRPLRDRDLLAEAIADAAESEILFGHPGQAEELLDRALVLARENALRTETETEADPRYQRTLARVLSLRGAASLALGRPEEARDSCREAIDRLEPQAVLALPTLLDQVSSGRYLPLFDQIFLVSARHDLAWALRQLGEPEEADRQLRLASGRMAEVSRALDGLEILDVDHSTGWISSALARSLADRDESGGLEAMALLDEAIPRLESLVARNEDFWQLRATLADALAVRARLRERAGLPDEARRDAEAALALMEPVAPTLGTVAEAWSPLADALETLARIELAHPSPDPGAARDRLRQALDARRRALDARPGDPEARARLDEAADRLGRLDDGEDPGPPPAG